MSKDSARTFGKELLNFLFIREEGLGNGDGLAGTEDLFGGTPVGSANIQGI
jgi:hypothetical protein